MEDFTTEIDEALLFNDEDKELLQRSVIDCCKLRIFESYPIKTIFRITATTKDNLEKARYLLGKCVVYIHDSRK